MFDLPIRYSLCANELGNQDYHVNGIIGIFFVHEHVYYSVEDACLSTFFNKWIVYHYVNKMSIFLETITTRKKHTFFLQ